jgi:hypothetical protein
VLRRGPLLDDVAPALALEHVRDLLEHLPPELAALQVLVPEGDAEAENGGAGVVDVLVELLDPEAHLRLPVGVVRAQARRRKGILQVFENDVGFGDHAAVVDQRRDDGAPVELKVCRRLVLARAQDQVLVLPGERLLGKAHAHLLRTERHVVVIERQHGPAPASFA